MNKYLYYYTAINVDFHGCFYFVMLLQYLNYHQLNDKLKTDKPTNPKLMELTSNCKVVKFGWLIIDDKLICIYICYKPGALPIFFLYNKSFPTIMSFHKCDDKKIVPRRDKVVK